MNSRSYYRIRVRQGLELFSADELKQHAISSRFNVGRMASKLGMCVSKLEREFKRKFGMTPHVWLHDLRMSFARWMLACGVSIKETSFVLGFSDVHHFSTGYHTFHGHCPSATVRVNDFCRPGIEERWRRFFPQIVPDGCSSINAVQSLDAKAPLALQAADHRSRFSVSRADASTCANSPR